MGIPRPAKAGPSSRFLIQPDDHSSGWWALSIVRHRIVGALLMPDPEIAQLVGHEIHAALEALWAVPRAPGNGQHASSPLTKPTASKRGGPEP